jgi:hypothetical protein
MISRRGLHAARRALVTLLALATLAAAAEARAETPLHRFHDPVVLTVAKLTGLPERRTADLRLYRFAAGKFVPIPYQFDARGADGQLVLDDVTDFFLGDADELVFMAKDAGPRATEGRFPEGSEATLEITLAEPDGDGRAYAYLAAFRSPPPPVSFEPYVTYDAETREARSAFYRVDYASARNYFTGVHVLEPTGGDHPNLLRQSRMHGSPTFSLLVTDVTLDFTEQNSIVEIDGVRTGPVRSIRRVKLSVDLGPLFPELPSGISYTYHYLTSYTTPTRVKFPWIMLQALRGFRFEDVLDFRPDALPMRYFDASHPRGIVLGGADPREIETTDDHDWWVHSGRAGTMLHALVIPQIWRDWGVVRGTVVRSGTGATEDDGSGRAYEAGYTLLNMTSLREAGAYDMLLASVVLPHGYVAGDEAGPMAMLRAPLVASVRRIR